MPNLDDNAVNLSVLAGLCTTFVSLFGSAGYFGSIVIKRQLGGILLITYFSSSRGPFMASTLPYFLFLVDTS